MKVQGLRSNLATGDVPSDLNLVVTGEPAQGKMYNVQGLVQALTQRDKLLRPFTTENECNPSGGVYDAAPDVQILIPLYPARIAASGYGSGDGF